MSDTIVWPKEKSVKRRDDMSSSDTLQVGIDESGDLQVCLWTSNGYSSVEFCSGSGGGGKSPNTRLALIALMVAMEADNDLIGARLSPSPSLQTESGEASERVAFDEWWASTPEWTPEFEVHRPWVENLCYWAWQRRGAALQAPKSTEPEWQPIETAPKDGTLILLGRSKGVWAGKYTPVFTSGYRPDSAWQSMLLNHDHMAERYAPPTHWMPLPQPPTSGN
jgi:hypothetical protein